MKDFIFFAGWIIIIVLSAGTILVHRKNLMPVILFSLKQFLQIRILIPCVSVLCAAFVMIIFMKTVDASDKLRLVQSNIFGVATLIPVILILMQSATTLPKEIEQKQVFHLFSKPLSREALAAGRAIGFSLTGGFILLIAFFLNLFLVAILSFSDTNISAAKRDNQYIPAQFHSIAGKTLTQLPDEVIWLNKPNQNITWNFTLSPPSRFVAVEVTPVVAAAIKTKGLIKIFDDRNNNISKKILLSDNQGTIVDFEFEQESENISVEIIRDTDTAPLGFKLVKNEMGFEKNGLHLIKKRTFFELNLLLGYLVLFAKIALFGAVGVFCSSFLSAPVAAFFAFFLFFLSNIISFLSSVTLQIGLPDPHSCSVITETVHELSFFDYLLKNVLYTMCSLFPDFSRFDLSDSVCAGRAVSLKVLLNSFIYYGKYFLFFLLLSGTLIKRREF
ncbi:MAG: hypothetical protein ABIH42_10755 [Planctomycetota bacterium]